MNWYSILFPNILEINAFDASHEQPRADKQTTNTDICVRFRILFYFLSSQETNYLNPELVSRKLIFQSSTQ